MKDKKLTKDELEEGLKSVLNSILESSDKEDKKSPIFNLLKKNIKYLEDPDDFNSMAIYPIKRIINTFVKTQFKENNYLAESIYTDYDFFENNISHLCSKMEGSFACVDKARFLIRTAIRWKETDIMPIFDWTKEYTFQYPKIGNPEQWMNFIEGLNELLYGANDKYLLALKSLIEEYNKKSLETKEDKE